MTTFGRKFEISLEQVEQNAFFRDLLNHWRPAGEAAGKPWSPTESKATGHHLRLAIRNGYSNFYRAGQSVAKVNQSLTARVHSKYVDGSSKDGQKYIKVSDDQFMSPNGAQSRYTNDLLPKWIGRASEYAGLEKIFVDELIARNANVIDVEAGIPGQADRMDLVALEPDGNNWRLAFWEAKLVTNAEARCKEGDPKVVKQLERYEEWLTEYQDDVRMAYQRTCVALVKLHRMAKELGMPKPELGRGIIAAAGQAPKELGLDCKPRLIIDATHNNVAFTDNGHLNKLRAGGIEVVMVKVEPEKDLKLAAWA